MTEYDDEFAYGATRAGNTFREMLVDIPSPPASPGLSQNSRSALPSPPLDAKGYPPNLRALIDLLQTPSGLKMYKTAYRENMEYKITRYGALLDNAQEDVIRQVELIKLKTPELKKLANVDGPSDNWNIFESISSAYLEAKDRATSFEAIKIRATQRLDLEGMYVDEVKSNDAIKGLRDQLVRTLHALSNYSSQPHVITKTVDIVGAFIKDPKLFRTKMMNFMLLGGAGTGKTSIAEAIGDVFAKAGIFVGNKLVEAGRAELVAQYEGQTVARTRNFLVNNLDTGVIFIDEAYAITPWQNGKPEGYGSEAATAMVEFMTRYTGLYCIIVAGYETQMTRYFLPTNEGMSRRFPNKFVLRNMSADDLITVFKRALLKSQGLPLPDGKQVILESEGYFNRDAWTYLQNLVQTCTRGTVTFEDESDDSTRKRYKNVRVFQPTWEYLYTLFENQAGSMTNLADEAITVLMGTISYQEVINTQKKLGGGSNRPPIKMQSKSVMRDIVVQRILNTALSNADNFLAQLEQVESLI